MIAAMLRWRVTILSLILAVAPAPGVAQTGGDDEFLEQYAATFRFSLGQPAGIQITERGDAVLFLRSGPRSFVRDLYEFDLATGEERLVASANDILQGEPEQLTAEELARRERMRSAARGIASFDLSRDGRRILVPLSGSLYVVERANGASRELNSSAGYPIDARFSRDGNAVACVRDGDLYVIDVATSAERRLTQGASDTLTHGLAEFVAQEEMGRMQGYWWSPGSDRIAYQETDASQVELWHIAEPTQPSGAPTESRYPRPGENNARVRLGIVAVTGGETTWVRWDANRYPYLAAVTWEENAPLTILVQNREQTEELLLEVDPRTGAVKQLLQESDPAWVNLDQNMPHWLNDGESFLWSTERAGAWQLERRHRDGSLAATLTPPELGYRGVAGIDEEHDAVYVIAGDDPTQSHLFRVSLEAVGPSPERLTDKAGLHSAVFSDQGGVSVRTARTLAGQISHTVYRSDSSKAGDLNSVAEKPPFLPSVELAIVGDEPRLHASIIRPRDFAAGQRYPVIVNVYGGPHGQTVAADGLRYVLNQWIADRGFIVVSIDGRGTPARGRVWERAIKGNFVELPLADQVRGLQALGEKYDELDLARVGIYGWSFGGYMSAMAVMQRPDVFHVGVAGAPVADFRDYDTHYTERYLGLPEQNAAGYDASSVLTYVDQLRRPLLIIHGTTDDNVYFLHSMKLCDALFRAGKQYDFLPLAGFTHMVPDPLVNRRLYGRIVDYFVEHLKRERQTSPINARDNQGRGSR
jgi:dipeptidyl-peptidase-4